MRYLTTIFQGPNWTTHSRTAQTEQGERAGTDALSEKTRPLAPGIYAIFEQKKDFPNGGTDWTFLTEAECAAALVQTPHPSALAHEFQTALAGLARMKALITRPLETEPAAPTPSL